VQALAIKMAQAFRCMGDSFGGGGVKKKIEDIQLTKSLKNLS